MSYTKIKKIHTTVNKAVDYICDPNKTEEQTLIDTFACGSLTAPQEFENTRKEFTGQHKGRRKVCCTSQKRNPAA